MNRSERREIRLRARAIEQSQSCSQTARYLSPAIAPSQNTGMVTTSKKRKLSADLCAPTGRLAPSPISPSMILKARNDAHQKRIDDLGVPLP